MKDAETSIPSTVWLVNRARGGPPPTIESAKAKSFELSKRPAATALVATTIPPKN